MKNVVIGWSPKQFINGDGSIVDNEDYVEPECTQESDECVEEGTIRFDYSTHKSYFFTNNEWIEMTKANSVMFIKSKREFDICGASECKKDLVIYHSLGVVPLVVLGKTIGRGWFSYNSENPEQDIIINDTMFPRYPFKEVTDKHIKLDTDVFTSESVYYLFSERSFGKFATMLRYQDTSGD